ncbi:hypothetical protein OTK49_02910 [Vibrio coralliirubri]|uniref:hypothetical protein n=1 Tax=Vibrio coralliirubri TaxID=1516159 RepID=UPI0022845066|nr:hypothetical protein [Vibrio coralliirubri]MCY9861465.1 hypothetical protein [Vibrio coralliirubri]
MNAKVLVEFLKSSDNPEIVALASAIDTARAVAIEGARTTESPESSNYWRKHKFVALIKTDWDFYVKHQDSDEVGADVSLEWVGDSREDVIAQALQYLTNLENFTGSERNIQSFIENYLVDVFEQFRLGDIDEWCSGGNWDIDYSYEKPDSSEPESENYYPHVNFFGQRIDLLSEAELVELGFVSSKD